MESMQPQVKQARKHNNLARYGYIIAVYFACENHFPGLHSGIQCMYDQEVVLRRDHREMSQGKVAIINIINVSEKPIKWVVDLVSGKSLYCLERNQAA